jgi:Cu/Ag efflux pump CusA
VYKQSGADIQKTANAVRAKIESLRNTELRGLDVLVPPATDAGKEVGKQLGELTQTGIETVILVMAVLLLTIGWRESFVAALSIPLSFLIAFLALYLTGNTLNFISLFALGVQKAHSIIESSAIWLAYAAKISGALLVILGVLLLLDKLYILAPMGYRMLDWVGYGRLMQYF